MSLDSQNKPTWIEQHPGAEDFLPVVTDPGTKKRTTPAQKPPEKPEPSEQGEPLIAGGPTPQDIEEHKPGAVYEYADVPKEGMAREKFRYELALDDCYPVQAPDPELMQDPETALEEQHDYQKRLAVKERLRALFTGIPASSPLLKLIEHGLLQSYPAFRQSPTKHPDRLCEIFTDALLFDAASFLDSEQEMVMENEVENGHTLLHTLPVARRIKTQHASQPLFAGFIGTVALDDTDVEILKDLNELQLLFFENLAERLKGHPLALKYPLLTFTKLADADSTPGHIYPECRGALASVYPIWWDPQYSFGWHSLYRFVEDNNLSPDHISPAAQTRALLAHKKTGRKRAIESGQTNRMPVDIAKLAGKAVESLLLEPRDKESPSFKQLRTALQPFHDASRAVAGLYADHLSRRRILELFEKDGMCRPLIARTAHILADAYVHSYLDSGRISPEEKPDSPPVLVLLEQVLKNNGMETFNSRFAELFPDHLPEWLPAIGPIDATGREQLVGRGAQWLMTEHYSDVLRFTMFLMIAARLIDGDALPYPSGTVIPQVRLKYDPHTDMLKVCDALLLPQSCDASRLPSRTIEAIRATYPDAPISIIEVKTIISLYRFPNPPRTIRMHDLPQVESYVRAIKEGHPQARLGHVFLHYVTMGGARLLAYAIQEDQTLRYDPSATAGYATQPLTSSGAA